MNDITQELIERWLSKLKAPFKYELRLTELLKTVLPEDFEGNIEMVFAEQELEILAWVSFVNGEIQKRREGISKSYRKELIRRREIEYLVTGNPDDLSEVTVQCDPCATARLKSHVESCTQAIGAMVVNPILAAGYRRAHASLKPIVEEMRAAGAEEAKSYDVPFEESAILRRLGATLLALDSAATKAAENLADRRYWSGAIIKELGTLEQVETGSGYCPGSLDEVLAIAEHYKTEAAKVIPEPEPVEGNKLGAM